LCRGSSPGNVLPGLNTSSTVDELFSALATAPRDESASAKTLKEMQDLLLQKHHFGLTAEDQSALEHVYNVFAQYGPTSTTPQASTAEAAAVADRPTPI
jgi:hypothetical protein